MNKQNQQGLVQIDRLETILKVTQTRMFTEGEHMVILGILIICWQAPVLQIIPLIPTEMVENPTERRPFVLPIVQWFTFNQGYLILTT